MISWVWCLVAFTAGTFLGLFVLSMMAAAANADAAKIKREKGGETDEDLYYPGKPKDPPEA